MTAAAFVYGGDASQHCIVVKLTRTLALIPVVTTPAFLQTRREAGPGFSLRTRPWRRIVPLSLLGFIAAAALNSLGVVPGSWHPALSTLGTFVTTMALSGIGRSLRPADMRHAVPGRCCSAACCGSPSPPPASRCRPSPGHADPNCTGKESRDAPDPSGSHSTSSKNCLTS
ncbi:putative sulfate exporter family transporter [Amycolatopsis sp. MtRt-6]|uniref:putative sulfate exporter family transporter n=1 Tax=Amycolatopsis sp. MtRt-6 TaxID=2792782 RepID=UPI0027DE820E|nr:putative sulfate exporter family transporter [Amycolatopsis sp. MtRt-6]